jgi:hypothetical protein
MFYGLSQSFWTNAMRVPQINPYPLLSINLQIHCSLSNLIFDATVYNLSNWQVVLNIAQINKYINIHPLKYNGWCTSISCKNHLMPYRKIKMSGKIFLAAFISGNCKHLTAGSHITWNVKGWEFLTNSPIERKKIKLWCAASTFSSQTS